jgi:hypothetical protein
MDEVDLRRACSWIGNNAKIAIENNALIRQTDFLDVGQSGAKGGAALNHPSSQAISHCSIPAGKRQ